MDLGLWSWDHAQLSFLYNPQYRLKLVLGSHCPIENDWLFGLLFSISVTLIKNNKFVDLRTLSDHIMNEQKTKNKWVEFNLIS